MGGAVIVLLTIAAYARTLHGEWLWDDDQDVTRNAALRSVAGLRQIWTAPAGVNYFPLTQTVEWVEWQAWGDRPEGYRCVNLGLHVLAALLVAQAAGRLGLRRGWLAGLLFAVHPLAVESVAWISELKNTLSLVLALLAFSSWVDFARGRSRRGWPALGWFVAALLAKSTVAGLPVVLAGVRWRRELIACFAAALASGTVTIWFEHARAIGSVGAVAAPMADRLQAAGVGVWFYLGKCLLPVEQSPIYPRWQPGPWGWVGVAGLLAACWALYRWSRPAGAYAAAFVVMLAPTLGLIRMAYQRLSWVADHFAYAALPVFAIATVALVEALHPRRGAVPAGWLLVLGIAGYSWATFTYGAFFTSPEALWTRTLAENPRAWSAQNDLGYIRYTQQRLPEAIARFDAAIRLHPDYPEAHNNLGVALAASRRWEGAAQQYHTALALRPGYPSAECNLGNVYLQTGRPAEAAAAYRTALAAQPAFPEAHYNLGLALRALGREAEARHEFEASGLRAPTN